jgi:hypothetical protein
MIKYFINYQCGSDLILACQHLSLGTNLRECKDQRCFKVQAVPINRFDRCKMFSPIL